MKKLAVMMAVAGLTASIAGAAYLQDFNTFTNAGTGYVAAQQGWADSPFNNAAVGGAIQRTSDTDKRYRMDGSHTPAVFDLTYDQGGIEMGFEWTLADRGYDDPVADLQQNAGMYLRETTGGLAYGPEFGMRAGFFRIRPQSGNGADNITGTFLADAGVWGAPGTGLMTGGETIKFTLTFTGANFEIATMNAYNLSRGGTAIPTGLTNVDLSSYASYATGLGSGYNIEDAARIGIRSGAASAQGPSLSGSSAVLDNVYITDVIPEPATLSLLGLAGGALFLMRRNLKI